MQCHGIVFTHSPRLVRSRRRRPSDKMNTITDVIWHHRCLLTSPGCHLTSPMSGADPPQQRSTGSCPLTLPLFCPFLPTCPDPAGQTDTVWHGPLRSVSVLVIFNPSSPVCVFSGKMKGKMNEKCQRHSNCSFRV